MRNRLQIFCFTYAGGSAAFFDVIEKDLKGVDVVKFEYAGHGIRHKEGFYRDFYKELLRFKADRTITILQKD